MKEQIKKFIVEEIMEEPNYELEDDYEIIEESLIDSTEILKIVIFLEENFDIEIDNEEVTIDNFNSINDIYDFAMKKKSE